MSQIRKAREKKRWSLDKAAEKLNVTKSHLSYIENRKRNPSLDLLNNMVEVYGEDILLDYLPALKKGGIKNDGS